MKIVNISFDNPNDFITKIVSIGVSNNASDIHISPGKETIIIKYRIGGELRSIYKFGNELYGKFINAIKIKSGMDITEHGHIQDGKIFMSLIMKSKKIELNLRVSSLPVIYGENIVIRILLANNKYLNVESLGFSDENTNLLKTIEKLNEGLILVSGGTGSGKTTTIYSLLNLFEKTKLGIFTLEDPIEYQVDGYIQSQINNIKGSGNENDSYTFKEGLIGILRQDPDIIMIGELRSEYETKTCFEAANTGHLVMGTIHSNNSISVITRVKQLGIEAYLIASSLKFIISQKINKSLCFNCKKKKIMKKSDFSEKIQNFIKTPTINVYESNIKGCSKCKNGFNGITLLGEIIQFDSKLYDIILNDMGENEIKNYLFSKGFIPYYIDALNKSIKGLIDINDISELEY